MNEFFTGVVDDPREPEEKSKDWSAVEVLPAYAPIWKEKELKQYPIWSQGSSGSCFPANTQVLMEDFQYKPISQIRLGDVVFSNEGNKKKVTHLFKRKWQGRTRVLRINGEFEEIEATLEHPIYAIKKNPNCNKNQIQLKPYNEPARYYEIKDLVKGDYVGFPVLSEVRDTTINSFEKDPDFLWVLGLYLAEGSVGTYKVTFSLHKDELDFYERIKKTMKKYGTNTTMCLKKGSKSMSVCIQGGYWADVFNELGGKYCDKKEINKRLMFIEPHLQMKIIEGIFDGDGCNDKRGRNILVSTSYKMIKQVKIILLRNHIYSSIQSRKKLENRKQVYVLEYSKTSKNSFFREGWCFANIGSVKTKKAFGGGHVYNIEVEDDNSYVVNGVGVHNCVAFSKAKQVSIEVFNLTGVWIDFSPAFIYQKRKNNGVGMWVADANDIVVKQGTTLEAVMKSQNLTEDQINKVKETLVAKGFAEGVKRACESYFYLPIDMDSFARVLDNHAVSLLIFAEPDEYTTMPVARHDYLTYETAKIKHQVTAVDYFLKDGQRCLWIEDSWGEGTGQGGRRIFTEDFVLKRVRSADYFDRFLLDPQEGIDYKFYKTMKFGDKGEQVILLQNFLKDKGYFPVNQISTGNYLSITAKAVLDWQLANNVDSEEELLKLQGHFFGPKSLRVVNQ